MQLETSKKWYAELLRRCLKESIFDSLEEMFSFETWVEEISDFFLMDLSVQPRTVIMLISNLFFKASVKNLCGGEDLLFLFF